MSNVLTPRSAFRIHNYQRMGPNLSEEVTETNCEDEAQYDITQYKPKQGEVQSWQGSYISSETAHSASESTC